MILEKKGRKSTNKDARLQTTGSSQEPSPGLQHAFSREQAFAI